MSEAIAEEIDFNSVDFHERAHGRDMPNPSLGWAMNGVVIFLVVTIGGPFALGLTTVKSAKLVAHYMPWHHFV